jgi:heme/copper-type cytochrome/quinol oxidase subunit 2
MVVLVIVLGLLGISAYFIWRQRRTLRYLQEAHDLSDEDRLYLRNQAWRRLGCCTLMVILAALLDGAYLLGLQDQFNALSTLGDEMRAAGQEPVLTAEQERFLGFYSLYWMVILLVLLGTLVVAGWDFWAIFRFGQRHRRQLQVDRHAMIEREAARLRSERNGHRGARLDSPDSSS